jgi:hypothetical protein
MPLLWRLFENSYRRRIHFGAGLGEDPDTALDKAAKIVQEALNEALGK